MHKASAPGPKSSTIRTYICDNKRCAWYSTGWIVQLRKDGTIAERSQGEKDFQKLTPGQEAAARRYIETTIELDRQESGELNK